MKEELPVTSDTPLWEVVCAVIGDHFYASGASQKEFAKDVGVARTTLAGWLLGSHAPTLHNLQNIAGHLGIPPRCLQCRDTDPVCPTCTPKRRPPRS